jgi:thymidine phosphorylase
VGLSGLAGLGEAMTPDMPIGRIHAANEDAADLAEQLLRKAYVLAEERGETPPLILRSIR